MDIISLISSVSKVAILAFGITLAFVGYEVYTIMKNRQQESQKQNVNVPAFHETGNENHNFTDLPEATVSDKPVGITHKISKNYLVLVGILIVVIIGIFGVFVYQRTQVEPVDVAVDDVSPVREATQTAQLSPTDAPTPTTTLAESTPIPTSTETPEDAEDPEDPEDNEDNDENDGDDVVVVNVTSTPTPGAGGADITTTPKPSLTDSVTATPSSTMTTEPTSTTLPQAGTINITLIIATLALGVIYLALIL